MPKPRHWTGQYRAGAGGAQGRGRGGGTSRQGVWESRSIISDKQGQAMDRGGGGAIRRMEQQKNDQLVERLGRQMKELFIGLTLKQEADNRRLRQENLAIRKQMLKLEKEKWEPNNRMELLMGAVLRQMGGQVLSHATGSAEVTPEKGSRPAVVMPVMPSTRQKRARPGVMAPQGAGANGTASAASPGGLGAKEAAELVRRSQVLEEALWEVMTTGEAAPMVTGFLQATGHHEVVGMIESGSQKAPAPE